MEKYLDTVVQGYLPEGEGVVIFGSEAWSSRKGEWCELTVSEGSLSKFEYSFSQEELDSAGPSEKILAYSLYPVDGKLAAKKYKVSSSSVKKEAATIIGTEVDQGMLDRFQLCIESRFEANDITVYDSSESILEIFTASVKAVRRERFRNYLASMQCGLRLLFHK